MPQTDMSYTCRYSFSKIFQPSCGQASVFGEVVAPKVKDFLEGQNQLLFTYGATSAGKTYTIQVKKEKKKG